MYVTNNQHTEEKWIELVEELETSRFFLDQGLKIFDFIDDIKELKIQGGQGIYYRSRVGEYTKDDELAAPPKDKVLGGRLNPKGIPYIYVAESIDTAIAEVRPWIGAIVSIAECHNTQEIRVKDFTHDVESEDMSINDFRMVINKLLAKPVNPSNSDLEYLSTQAIAEYIRSKGYDGIRYLSATDKNGINIAIFDPSKMCVKYLCQEKITGIQYKRGKYQPLR